jgi:hypothetical protein
MCLPAIPLMIAATAISSIGSIVGAVGQSNQAKYAANVADQNAKIAANQAHDSELNTNLEARQRARAIGQTQGAQQAAMAANGVDLNFGTSMDIQRDTYMIGSEDLTQIYKQGNERTKGFDMQAGNYRAEAASQRAKASGAMVGGIFGAASTALGGATQVAKMKKMGY